jgi:histidine triad (HIT) family protein
MTNCIFCKIISGDISGDIIYQDDDVLAFRDLNPQAPTHFLLIPKKHIATINDLQTEDAALMGKLYLAAKRIAKDQGIEESGYRTVMNCNADGGQSVYHIHLHVLGGRNMSWPPG